jgi:hypothetical protein
MLTSWCFWKVDIPDDQDIDSPGLAIEGQRLKPTWSISDYWEKVPLKKHIHILVRGLASKYPVS